jgi:hypothetical protein
MMRSLIRSLRAGLARPLLGLALVLVATAGLVPSAAAEGEIVDPRWPDLRVASITTNYDFIAHRWYTGVVIRNAGYTKAGQFYVSNAGQHKYVAGLSASTSIALRYYKDDCESGGLVTVDVFKQVPESNENNNSVKWLHIC